MKITEDNYLYELRNNNQEALSFVITMYGGLVMSIIQKHLYMMKEKQEECFDDVFLSVWYHIKKYDEGQNSFKNWIAAISKNQAIASDGKVFKPVYQFLNGSKISQEHNDITGEDSTTVTMEAR